MKYTVYIRATEYGYTEIEAKSREEAIDLAYEAEINGDVSWGDREIEITHIDK